MSEYPEERLLIQNLWDRFHKDFLKTAEVADYDGCSAQTVRRRYGITGGGISIVCLAHKKCQLARGKRPCR